MERKHVAHAKYGHGVALQTRLGGHESLVDFRDGLTRWVLTEQLSVEERVSASASVPTPATPSPDAAFASRRMVEAFRLGIVPQDCVDRFTFGRDEELRQMGEWLKNGNSGSLLVVGPYGSGKSHFLSCLTQRALKDGYAVAEAELDGRETSFSKPKSVYRHLAGSLRFMPKGGLAPGGFRALLEGSLANGGLRDHPYFGALRSVVGTGQSDAWEWIMGEPARSYFSGRTLYDHTTAANIYCNLLSGLGAATRSVNQKGLLVVLDEAESVFSCMWTSPYYYERGMNFMHALLKTSNDDMDLRGDCRNSDLTYSKLAAHVPFIYGRLSNIKVVMGFTPSEYVSVHLPLMAPGTEVLTLSPLSEEALQQAGAEIRCLYRAAYPSSKQDLAYGDSKSQKANDMDIRMFVKASVEALDIARFRVRPDDNGVAT